MHCHSTRALPAAALAFSLLISLLAGPVSVLGQAGRRPIQPIPPRPAVTTPGTPAIVTPGRPAIVTPGRPAIVSPGRPAVVTPGQPGVLSRSIPIDSQPLPPSVPITTYPLNKPTKPGLGPGHGPGHDHGHGHGHWPWPGHGDWHKPKPPYCPPKIIIIPSFPSAFIGPEIVSITNYPTETELLDFPPPSLQQEQEQGQAGVPASLQGDAATPRLVAILGRIDRVDGRTGTGRSTKDEAGAVGDGDRLCLGLGTLTVYFNPDPEQAAEAMARGTFLGSRWDGDSWHTSATGLWSRGPVTRQPIFTLHELQPSGFPFEVAVPGRRITSMRMALALVRDTSSSAPPLPSQSRHVTMANSLRRHLQEADEPIPLTTPLDPQAPTPSGDPDPTATYLGNAHSPFGQALATSLQELLTTPSLPQPSSVSGSVQPPLNNRSATAQQSQTSLVAEWTLPLSDLRDILSGCPRFTTIPLPADLQTVRSRDTSPAPLWVRPFRIEVPANSEAQPAATYQGEVWFLIVPDEAIRS